MQEKFIDWVEKNEVVHIYVHTMLEIVYMSVHKYERNEVKGCWLNTVTKFYFL